MTRRELILAAVKNSVVNLLYYDRKDDEELRVGDVEDAIKSGEVSIDEMNQEFNAVLRDALK